jgi:glycyl-tRNA synthetase beta chain
LSIADKIDSIVGCFSAGLVPTGSQDPYALRRQAIGIVRMIDEGGLALPLSDLASEAGRAHGTEDEAKLTAGVLDFVRQRARVFYIDAGYAYDLVDAVLEASLDELSGVRPRLSALSHFRENEDFEGLVIGARRVMNILKGQPAHAYDPTSLVEPSSRALEEARAKASVDVEGAIGAGDLDRAVKELLKLRKPIDDFFDDVMVMVDDEEVRNMRLGLLAAVRTLFLRIADFARVVLEGEEREEGRG